MLQLVWQFWLMSGRLDQIDAFIQLGEHMEVDTATPELSMSHPHPRFPSGFGSAAPNPDQWEGDAVDAGTGDCEGEEGEGGALGRRLRIGFQSSWPDANLPLI